MRRNTPNYVKGLAKDLRKEQTEAEGLLWQKLRGKRLNGVKFNRQCPIGRYIADFYCSEANLVIEVDGGIHEEENQKLYDEIRQKDIEGRNMTVLRFSNEEIISDIEAVLQKVVEHMQLRK